MRFCVNVSSIFFPISLWLHMSSFILSAITTLVTKLKRSVLSSVKGFVNLVIVDFSSLKFFHSRAKTVAERQ